VRCDFNVPIIDGKITDDNRITAALPTIKKLIADGGRVILCSHLGKPKGPDPKATLAPVAERLQELLGMMVLFAADDNVVGENAKRAVENMKDGHIVLLENTRFRPGEGKNDEEFSKDLASIADVYVNDAFGFINRGYSSPPTRRRRTVDGKRNQHPRQGNPAPTTPTHRHYRREKDCRQDAGYRQSSQPCKHNYYWRWNDIYVHQSSRWPRWEQYR
jgi:hypothetical protein